MTIQALAGDVVALLDHLGIAEADLFGFSLGGLVAYAVALSAPARVGKLIVASADTRRPPGRESAPPAEDRMPAPAGFRAMHDACQAVAPDPAHFGQFAARTSAMVHEFPGRTDELRSLQVQALLIFGDRDFSPLLDVMEMFELLPDAQLAVLTLSAFICSGQAGGGTQITAVQRASSSAASPVRWTESRISGLSC
jgi:pimeloyl-ACP methyl ester carboxylesterase